MRNALLAMTVILTLLICGCAGANAGNYDNEEDVSVVTTDDGTVNGYRMQSSSSGYELLPDNINSSALYYANKNSKTFHKKDCSYVSKIKSENLYVTSDRNELITSGYRSCKFCKP